MIERSKAEVAALVKARMKELGMTQGRLQAAAKVDPKTLRALLDGERWPQEENRLKFEKALGWQVGSIQEIRAGNDPTPIEPEPESPLLRATDDELLAEVRRRLERVSVGGDAAGDELKDDPVPGSVTTLIGVPVTDDPAVVWHEKGDKRDKGRGT